MGSPRELLVLLVALVRAVEPSYTYKFEYDLTQDPIPSASIIPITGMPSTHPNKGATRGVRLEP